MQDIHVAWFRQDLRLQDNPMLAAAAEGGIAVLPVYIHAPHEAGNWPPGAASRWWLHHALGSLQAELRAVGMPLILCQGSSLGALEAIVQELGNKGLSVRAVFSSRLQEPALAKRDQELQQQLEMHDIAWQQHNAGLLIEPAEMYNQSGLPYRVFTPFWKKLRQTFLAAPVELDPQELRAPAQLPKSLPLSALDLLPSLRWDEGFAERWDPSLRGAHSALGNFLAGPVQDYQQQRDVPSVTGTSSLSPYLHFGQLGPRQVWAAAHAMNVQQHDGGDTFLKELCWREFASHLLHHFPHTDLQPLNARYAAFPWQSDAKLLRAWQRGQTGYPLVDAGMRQLWRTGWMHNRVRMITASFLVKHLLQPWQDGARWFWDTLVDADLANNSMGWQWVAGSGADAAPYFRIFNPVGQGERFDPQGEYVRHWVPELAGMPDRFVHQPWLAPADVLQRAKVQLGENYPKPVVDHKRARERALAALATL